MRALECYLTLLGATAVEDKLHVRGGADAAAAAECRAIVEVLEASTAGVTAPLLHDRACAMPGVELYDNHPIHAILCLSSTV